MKTLSKILLSTLFFSAVISGDGYGMQSLKNFFKNSLGCMRRAQPQELQQQDQQQSQRQDQQHNFLVAQAQMAIHIFVKVSASYDDYFFKCKLHPLEAIMDIISKLTSQKNSIEDLIIRAYEISMIIDVLVQFPCKKIDQKDEDVFSYMEKYYDYENRAFEKNSPVIAAETFLSTLIKLNKKLIVKFYTVFSSFLFNIKNDRIDFCKKNYFLDESKTLIGKEFYDICKKLNCCFSNYYNKGKYKCEESLSNLKQAEEWYNREKAEMWYNCYIEESLKQVH
jgi:hypothetical protein